MNKPQLLESLRQRGFSDEILNAFSKVERGKFVPERFQSRVYEDTALPIGSGQTISQPYTLANMLSLMNLKKEQKILEVGSGCGYVLALLSEMVGNTGEVYGIEIIKELAEKSKQNLKDYKNVKIYNRNGSSGLPEYSPFDRILMSAACSEIPKKLFEQLKEQGIIVAPVDSETGYSQDLVAVKKINNKSVVIKKIPGFVFVRFVE